MARTYKSTKSEPRPSENLKKKKKEKELTVSHCSRPGSFMAVKKLLKQFDHS